MTHTITVNRIPEQVVSGKRLGRHYVSDSRSLAYPVRVVSARLVAAQSWERRIPILDQGNVGSCTGNALTGAAGTDPLFPALPKNAPALDEAEALRIYSEAETIDGNGTYPPVDDGSCGLSVCKAAKADGLISGYLNATGLNAMIAALQSGPVIIGINWYDSFDSPSSSGLITIGRGAGVRGGHELAVRKVDPAGKLFGLDNSWGTSWGVGGACFLGFADMDRLFAEQGDCYQPLPLSVPAPVPVPPQPDPVPVPAPDADDALLWSRVAVWSGMRHVGANRLAARDVRTWAQSKNLL